MRPAQLAEQISRSAPQSVRALNSNPEFTEVSPPVEELTSTEPAPFGRWGRIFAQEWLPSVLIFVLDVCTWMVLYGIAAYVRDASFSGPFQFAVIDLIQLV